MSEISTGDVVWMIEAVFSDHVQTTPGVRRAIIFALASCFALRLESAANFAWYDKVDADACDDAKFLVKVRVPPCVGLRQAFS